MNSGKQMWSMVGGVVLLVLVTAGVLALVSKANMNKQREALDMIPPTRPVTPTSVMKPEPTLPAASPATNAEIDAQLDMLDKDGLNLNPTDTQINVNQ